MIPSDIRPKPPPPPPPPKPAPKAPPPQAQATATQTANAASTARQTAATAQTKAATDQQAAAKARTANQAAQATRTQATSDLTTAKSHVDTLTRSMDERGPRPGQLDQLTQAQKTYDTAKTKSDAANTAADQAQKAQDDAEATARASRQTALDTANKAIQAEQAANTAARAAQQPEPYQQANQVKDVFDAGSLSAKDQEQLFGAKSIVTPQEAGQSDATRVSEAAAQGPKQGAAELDRQLQGNDDPAYRSALMDGSKGAIADIGRGLNDPATSAQDASATVKSLASAADQAGDQGRAQIAASLGSGANVQAALKANASDDSVVKLGGAVADHLRTTGDYQGADAITKLDPKIAAASTETKGEQQARDAVKVTTVGDERAALEKGGQDALKTNAQTADQVFSLAGKDPKDLPPGVEAVKGTDPNRAELVARNKDGDITARTVAIRDGDQTTIQKTTYDKGQASYTSTTSNANGDFSTTRASWKAAPSATQADPSIDSLKNSRDPNVQIQQQSVHHDGDKLVESDYAQGKTGITETTKTYFQQSKGDATHSGNGIKDDFEGKFSDSQPVDVVNTHSISIPAGGVKGPDGKQAVPQESDSATFSQGSTRLERDAGTQQFKLDGDLPKDFHPAANDAKALDSLPGFAKGDKSPVQWKLEENKGNTYDAQTFVEGQKDLTTTTHREAHGSTVTESVSGKVPAPGGKDTVSISSKSEQTYAADGSLAHLHKDAHDPDGTHTVTNFDRTTQPGKDGLDINEHLDVQRTTKDGQTYGVDRKTDSRLSNEGVQLVSSDETITGPTGDTARTKLDATGTQTFVNGAQIHGKADLQGYPADLQHLAAQSGTDTFSEAQNFINNGGVNAVKLLGFGGKIAAPTDGSAPTTIADASNDLHQKLVDQFGQDNVDTAFRVQAGAVGGLSALGGLAGAVSNTNTLVDGIRDADFKKIATGVAGDVGSGLAIKNGGKAFLDAVKGLAPETLSADEKWVNTALKTAGWLDKVPGLSEDAATSGGMAAADASEFLGKLGGAASVVGIAASGYQLYNAIDSGNGFQIAQASVGLAGASAAGAVAIGAAIGSIEPGVGTLIGAGIGLATFGVQELIGLFDHSDTDIAHVNI